MSRWCAFVIFVFLCNGAWADPSVIVYPLQPLVHLLGDGEGHWGYGIEYAIDLYVGSPAQIIPVVVDSGSPGVVLYSSSCDDPDCVGLPLFSTNDSSTWQSLGIPINEHYIAGSLIGEYGTDRISFTTTDEQVNMTLAVMQSVNWTMPYFSQFNFSGILGASLSPPLVQNVSFIYQAFNEVVLLDDMFGFVASPDPYGIGEVVFGGYNTDYVANGITWHDVISFEPVPGHVVDWIYALPAQGLSVNGMPLNGSCANSSSPCIVVVDTGGAMMKFAGPGMPSLSVEPDCSNLLQLPTVTLWIDDSSYDFNPLDYVFKTNTNPSQCVSNAIGVDQPEIGVTVAGRFFAKFYSIFDNGNRMLGFSDMS